MHRPLKELLRKELLRKLMVLTSNELHRCRIVESLHDIANMKIVFPGWFAQTSVPSWGPCETLCGRPFFLRIYILLFVTWDIHRRDTHKQRLCR